MKTCVVFSATVGIALLAGCSPDKRTCPESVPVYAVDPSKGAADCKVGNYQSRTVMNVVTNGGNARLVFTRPTPVSPADKDTSWSLHTPVFPVTPGRKWAVRLVLSGHLPSAAYIKPGVRLEWLDESGDPLMGVDARGKDVPMVASLAFPRRKPGFGESRTISKGFVPAGAARARLFLGVDYPDLGQGESVSVHDVSYHERKDGTSWAFDDTEAPELQILTPSPTPDTSAPIRFRLTDTTGVDYGRFSCSIGGRSLTMAELKRDGDVFTYVPEKPWPSESVVKVKVGCADVNGYEAAEWGFVAISTVKVRHAKWTVRDDGMVLRDGKPFFPLGLTNVHAAPWCGADLDRGIAELKENGVNCVHTYMVRGLKSHYQSKHYDELVTAAEKHGVFFIAQPAKQRGTLEERDALSMPNLLYGRSAAAQWGWGVGDDTSSYVTPEELKRLYRLCKAVDRDLLAVSIDIAGMAPLQAPYVPFADVLVLENYPIRKPEPQDDEMAAFAQTLDNGREATRLAGTPNRSVFSMPQAFRGWNNWKRYPTKEELRCQLYLSLACRVRGIIAYTASAYAENEGALTRPETKAEFYALTREVSALLPSLVLRDAERQPVVTVLKGPAKNVLGGDSVRCLLKEDGLLVLANSSHETVEVSVALPSGKTIRRELVRNAGWAERTEDGKGVR